LKITKDEGFILPLSIMSIYS